MPVQMFLHENGQKKKVLTLERLKPSALVMGKVSALVAIQSVG